jgi:hypothetical protein
MNTQQIDALRVFMSPETTDDIQPNFYDVKTVADNIETVKNVATVATEFVDIVYPQKVQDLDDHTDVKKTELDTYVTTDVEPVIDTYVVNSSQSYTQQYIEDNAGTILNTYIESTSKPTIDAYVTTKTDEYNNNHNVKLAIIDTKVDDASSSATTATNQATISTTQATIATNKANEASISASNASDSETGASSSADTATSQATIATNKANEASISATTATNKANEATASANTATTKANEASTSASNASDSATSASTSATTATTQAGIATTKASEALQSASNASTSETNALTYKNDAEQALSTFQENFLGDHATEPVGTSVGQLYYDTNTNNMKVFDGSQWNTAVFDATGAVTSINGEQGDITLNKSYVGLSNVDNTSDADKPISTATQTVLDLKADATYVDELVTANIPFNGYIGDKKPMIFSTTVGNEYKMATADRFVNFDGKVIDTYGPELVTNESGAYVGDFSSGIAGWSDSDKSTADIIDGIAKVTNTVGSGDYGLLLDSEISMEEGKLYKIEFDCKFEGSDNISLRLPSPNKTYIYTNTEWEHKTIYLMAAGDYTTSFILRSGASSIGYWDNISVREITTVDMTNDMPEVTIQDQSEHGLVVQSSVNAGDYVVVDGTEVNDIYRAKQTAPALTSLTNTTYFEDRTQYGITNKILATMKEDGTIKTEVCFVDTAIEDCGNAHVVMTDNGYSKLNNGLYSKDGDIVTPIGTWTVSNSGNFHEVYNYFGMYADINDDIGVRSSLLNSTADCFNPANIGTAIGHPQGIDKSKYVTADQWIDLRIEANAISEQDELNRVGTKAKSGQLDGVGGVVATYMNTTYNTTTTTQNSGTDTVIYINDGNVFNVQFIPTITNANKYLYEIGDEVLTSMVIFGKTGVYSVIGIGRSSTYGSYFRISGNYSTDFETPEITGFKIVWTKTLPHPSSGTALRTDVIGDPANYPQEWKDRLASGLPLIGMNPLLVGQDGTDYTINCTPIFSHKGTDYHAQVTYGTDGYVVSTADRLNQVDNSRTSQFNFGTTTQAIGMFQYTAKIPTTQVSDPKAVKIVGNYVTGTNSHGIYKGNQLVPTGKVNVGNGTNGLESRVVENTTIVNADYVNTGISQFVPINTGDIVFNNDGNNINGINGTRYIRIGAYSASQDLSTTEFSNTSEWAIDNTTVAKSEVVASTPQHNTITLDNSNSPAVKFIETIAEDDDGMAHYQVFAQEMATNAGAYDGDDNQFTQLTNGILTDDNANTVKTVVASIPLNKYIGA